MEIIGAKYVHTRGVEPGSDNVFEWIQDSVVIERLQAYLNVAGSNPASVCFLLPCLKWERKSSLLSLHIGAKNFHSRVEIIGAKYFQNYSVWFS